VPPIESHCLPLYVYGQVSSPWVASRLRLSFKGPRKEEVTCRRPATSPLQVCILCSWSQDGTAYSTHVLMLMLTLPIRSRTDERWHPAIDVPLPTPHYPSRMPPIAGVNPAHCKYSPQWHMLRLDLASRFAYIFPLESLIEVGVVPPIESHGLPLYVYGQVSSPWVASRLRLSFKSPRNEDRTCHRPATSPLQVCILCSWSQDGTAYSTHVLMLTLPIHSRTDGRWRRPAIDVRLPTPHYPSRMPPIAGVNPAHCKYSPQWHMLR
jgi:hypothetical protein